MTLAIDAINEARAWAAVVRELAGDRRQPPPAGSRGRVYRCLDAPMPAAEIADAIAGGIGPAELGLLLGVTRQAALQRLQRHARQRTTEEDAT